MTTPISIAETQQELVDEFSFFDNWQDKYAHIIDLGRELPPLADEHKIEANRVKGCQSQVWMITRRDDAGRMIVEAESDALIVQGLIALLLRIFSNRSPAEIVDADCSFLAGIGLDHHLSMNRTNGLLAMLNEIRRRAALYQQSST